MVTEKNIEEFRDSGMLWLVNTFLHVFGWAIVVELDNTASGKTVRMFPARVTYRGFCEEHNTDGYIKVSQYMKDNAEILLQESREL